MNTSRRNLTNNERAPYWLHIINEWQISGKRVDQFCKEMKIGTASFYQWRKRLKPNYPLRTNKNKPITDHQPCFVPIQIKHDDSKLLLSNHSDGIVLHYPNGCYINLGKNFDPQMLTWINKAMGI